jgi:hypothetical protein
MDQMLIWALLHEEMSRRNRKRQNPVLAPPFWGFEWGALRTMWAGLDRRQPRDQDAAR